MHRVLDVSTRASETTAEVSETQQLLSELAESEAARDKAVQESQKSMRQLQEMSREAVAPYLQFQDDKFHKEDLQHVDVETTITSASVQEKSNHFDGFTEQDKLCQKEDELDVMRRLVQENSSTFRDHLEELQRRHAADVSFDFSAFMIHQFMLSSS